MINQIAFLSSRSPPFDNENVAEKINVDNSMEKFKVFDEFPAQTCSALRGEVLLLKGTAVFTIDECQKAEVPLNSGFLYEQPDSDSI